jgi:hypothetical protein
MILYVQVRLSQVGFFGLNRLVEKRTGKFFVLSPTTRLDLIELIHANFLPIFNIHFTNR